jgi:hypothetical protein
MFFAQVTVCLEAQFDTDFLKSTRDAFKANKQDNERFKISLSANLFFIQNLYFSLRSLELASYFCDVSLTRGLTHPPLINDVDLFDFIYTNRFYVNFLNAWRNSMTDDYYSMAVMEYGMCMTFNQISAYLIFRNDTVDLKFLQQFRSGASIMEPQSWSIETGYSSDGSNFYPLKSLNSGAESGFGVALATNLQIKELDESIDRECRYNPEHIKITLHHPAEVALKTSFIKMPLHKSVSMMVKPKITKTSDSLKSYDPEV